MRLTTIPTGLLCALLFIPFTGAAGTTANEQEMTPATFTLEPIGTVHKDGDQTQLILQRKYEPGLLGLDGFSHIWVFWWFDRNDTPEKRSILQVHPRGNKKNPLTGVFGTRSPVRPNLIAQTLCKVINVEENVIHIEWIDAFPHTPILDIKPYISGSDVAESPNYPEWIYRRD